jgi:hypothetical protein
MANTCGRVSSVALRGSLSRRKANRPPQIEACFARAIAITRTEGAKSLELRAARSLARLWRDQDAAVMLPLPPKNLRVWIGPFADADLFRESGQEIVRSIISLCGLKADVRALEIDCGCGRVAAN